MIVQEHVDFIYEIIDRKADTIEEKLELFMNPIWRVGNQYYCIDGETDRQFRPRPAQCMLMYWLYVLGRKRFVILKARQLGFSTLIAIIGLDHTLYNASLLERFAGRMRVALAGQYADGVRLAPAETVSWSLDLGTRFSILPLAGDCAGVTVEGAEYPLLGGDIGPTGVTAISNSVTFDPLLIRAGNGPLLVLVDREGPGPGATFEE